jgi:hypothetical protein
MFPEILSAIALTFPLPGAANNREGNIARKAVSNL